MKLRVVMLLVIGPLFGLAGFLMFKDIQRQSDYLDLAHATTVRTQEGALVGDVIHEMQKERGYSAGFIASKGKNFTAELAAQRESTLAAIDAMHNELVQLAAGLPETLQQADEGLTQLNDMRGRVDGFDITVPEMAKFYTTTINALIELSRPHSTEDRNSHLQALLNARALVGSAKESAGLERAMGASGLGGGFSLALHDRYVSLGGAQTALLMEAAGTLSDATWLASLYETPEFQTVDETRRVIRTGYENGDFGGLTPPQWFGISTNWINLLRERELAIVQQVADMTTSIEAETNASFRRLVWLGSAVSGFVLLFAVLSFERMVKRIKSMISVIDQFTKGNFDVFVNGIDGRDELSRMAKAVYHFKQDTLEMRKDAQALKDDQERVKKEQDLVVGELRFGLGQLAEGNLTHSFETPFPQEYESLRVDFNATTEKLLATLANVSDTTDNIRSSTTRFKQSSQDLSHRSENQTATLEQTAAALQDITTSIESAAQSARDVQATTVSAKQEATQSGEVVQQAVSAMAEISRSSDQIGQIVSVIDDIAFQTNLLALNAGVEAARAGSAGSGFAVVASEVRALAHKSSGAAREIQDLIAESSVSVSNGVELVNKAGDALETIVDRVSHISSLVSDMAENTTEQAEGLSEINSGVSQLEEVTQHNSIMAQDVNSTSTTLKTEADELDRLIGQFTLSGADTPTEDHPSVAA